MDIPDLEMISFEMHWAIRAKSELQKVNDCQRHGVVNSQSHTGDPKLTDSPIAQEVCMVRHHGQTRKNRECWGPWNRNPLYSHSFGIL